MGPDLESLFELEKSNKIRALHNLFNDRETGFRISRPKADRDIISMCNWNKECEHRAYKKQMSPQCPQNLKCMHLLSFGHPNKLLTYNFSWYFSRTILDLLSYSCIHSTNIHRVLATDKSFIFVSQKPDVQTGDSGRRILLRQDEKTGNIPGMKRERHCLTPKSGWSQSSA